MTTLPAQDLLPSERELEEPLNVVIIVTYAHPYIGSGLGVVAKCQAEYLASQGHHVTLVSSSIPRTSAIFALNGVTYRKVPSLALLERLHIPVPLLFFNTKTISAIKHADIVHVHDILYPSSFFATLIAKFYKKKVIVTQHVPHVYYENKIINTIEKAVFYTMGLITLWASDAVTVLNDAVYQWVKYYKDEVYFLPNGVDLKLFKPPTEQEKQSIRARYNIPRDEFVVLFVGRFVPKKGFDILYTAKDPAYLLVFAGGGIIPEALKIDHMVRIIGPLPQEELATLYQASDVFILPSYGEGFPLSLQEAMATGLPIITSKQNKLSKLLDSPLISYIDRTETDIKVAIKTIQGDEQLRKDMSEYSLKIARENYSWEKNTTKLVDVYRGRAQSNTPQDARVVYVTTSWDDGHRLDVRLAALLQKYGIKGTFYVCPEDREFKRADLLSVEDLLSVSKDFEIGGHTITHPHLTKIPIAQADDEIALSKAYLEEILQREVTSFCYPYGDYNAAVKDIVKKYGYSMARTTKRYAFDIPQDLFAVPTTFHTYSHYSDLHKILPFAQFSLHTMRNLWDWEKLAIALFERTCQTGGVFHLWGHSWEIEKLNGWQKLENILAHITQKGNVVHQTNTEMSEATYLLDTARSI